ncbi:hypothetical protein [Furfurilactobacillus rossiae]|uniref:Uncharacterized protein n=1 Tax=Furfurilactobacillus rossiae DSM 15814 TaxID=1114972 RepID=A0A0R1RPR8_9LACO|nr:hypothetical protein [Furfurilactobacillus rossiae]KRL56964.1 hypothetical protein FD35_GL001261 [Furfurilactobacillus rossiae DSM 15814]QFR67005.1 hypothetical protein LR814_07830 [Furfurilactobacillus rossiae]QLE62510.1 hypothetical protein LROSRS0_2466 [Furfurilactobacillus rossiae]
MTQHLSWRFWWLIHIINLLIAAALWMRISRLLMTPRNELFGFGIIALLYLAYMRLPFAIGSWSFVQWPVEMKLKVAIINAVVFTAYGVTACVFPNDFQASHASIVGITSGLAGMLVMYLPPAHPTFTIGFHIRQSDCATKVMLLFMGRGLVIAGIVIIVIGNGVPNVLVPVATGLTMFALIGGFVYGQWLDRRSK